MFSPKWIYNIIQIIDHSLRILAFFELCEVTNELHVYSLPNFPVLYDSDSCSQELQRSDHKNQERETIQPQSCIQKNDFWFC